MKKFSLMLACAGIISTAIYSSNTFSVKDDVKKIVRSSSVNNKKAVKKVSAMYVVPQREPLKEKKK